jgi:hypothetical protein
MSRKSTYRKPEAQGDEFREAEVLEGIVFWFHGNSGLGGGEELENGWRAMRKKMSAGDPFAGPQASERVPGPGLAGTRDGITVVSR